jgi:hypothetical protein
MRFYAPKTGTVPSTAKRRTQVGRTNKLLGQFRQRPSFSNPLDEEVYESGPPPLMDRDFSAGDTEAVDRTAGGRDARTPPVVPPSTPAYTVTNGTIDRTYDANGTSTAELADVLYTLIQDLKKLNLGIH